MSGCLSRSDIEQYHDGTLSPKRAAHIEAHLNACPSCARRAATFQQSQQAFLDDLREIDPASIGGDGPGTVDLADEGDGGPTPNAPVIEGYEILRELHRGGQGVVYQAIQKATQRKVAVKVLLEGAFASASARKRFDREVALVAQLKHPNIITIFDSGEAPQGRRYYIMDYIQGEPLNKHVQNEKLSLEEVLKLFAVVCRGVHYAHQRGVIHRDLKPSNIMVETTGGGQHGENAARGTPRILDFGLAKSMSGSMETLVSMTGQVFGTLPYMAPEQVSGKSGEIDARADVYALGVVLYELLTGNFPYPVDGQIAEVIKHIAETDPTPPSRAWRVDCGIVKASRRRRRNRAGPCPIDDEIETIILRCLAKDRTRRYAGADALAEDLERYLAGEAIQAKRDSRLYVLKKALPRHKVTIALAGVVLVTLISALLVSGMRTRLREQQAQRRAALIEQFHEAIMLMDAVRLDQLLERSADVNLAPALVHCYGGWAHLIRMEREEAIADASRAIELDPDNGLAYYLRAIIHVYSADFLDGATDFAKAQQCAGDTTLEMGLQGIVKGLLGQYEAAVRDLDRLVEERGGSAGMLWFRGFIRWYHLMRDPPFDPDHRWRLAEDSLGDVSAAARLYPTVPWVFDLRADLHNRMAWLCRARGDERGFENHLSKMERDGRRIMDLGAVGNAHRILSDVAWERGEVETALQQAQSAYEHLTGPQPVHSINKQDALHGAVTSRIWATWILGDAAAAQALAMQLADAHPTLADDFVFGFVASATAGGADAATLRDELMADTSDLGPPSWRSGFGLWAGAAFTGDTALARHVAGRLSVGFLDQLSWKGVWLRYLRGDKTDKALLRAAGQDLNRIHLARFTIALTANTPQARHSHLDKLVRETGHRDTVAGWIAPMLLRTTRHQPPPAQAKPTNP